MKKIASKIIASAFFASLSSTAFAESNILSTKYTLTRDCGADSVYVGPHLADRHGGYCLSAQLGMATVHVEYTEDKSRCDEKRAGYKGTYVGPNKAYEHGGTCLWIRGQDAASRYTTTKRCPTGHVYAGPNRPDSHGGSCIKQPAPSTNFFMPVPQAELRVTETYSKDCVEGTYVGPNRASSYGGQCLELPPFEYHHSYTLDKDSCSTQDFGIYLGPKNASLHGGVCFWDLRPQSVTIPLSEATNFPSDCERTTFNNQPGWFAGSGTAYVENKVIWRYDSDRGWVYGYFTGEYSDLGGTCLWRADINGG